MRHLSFLALIPLFWLGSASSLFAGLYHPELLQIEFDDEGNALPLGPENFWQSYMKVREMGRPPLPLPPSSVALAMSGGTMVLYPTNRMLPANPTRGAVEREIAQLRSKSSLAGDDEAKLTADLIMLNDEASIKEALNLLRRPERFVDCAHRARAFQSTLLSQAKDLEDSALRDYKFPEKLFNMNKSQLTWYRHLEKDYYLPWLQNRDRESQRPIGGFGANPNDEVDPLFPPPSGRRVAPIRFVNEVGEFKPGALAASEREKLPPDHMAIVQQMMLWNAWDRRLEWLLAELYIVQGQYDFAERLLDNCRDLGYSPPELSHHRALLQPVAEKLRSDKLMVQKIEQEKLAAEAERSRQEMQTAEQAKREKAYNERMNKIYVWTAFGLIVAVLAYWQSREIVRRIMNRGP
jgi:hypothetical protein